MIAPHLATTARDMRRSCCRAQGALQERIYPTHIGAIECVCGHCRLTGETLFDPIDSTQKATNDSRSRAASTSRVQMRNSFSYMLPLLALSSSGFPSSPVSRFSRRCATDAVDNGTPPLNNKSFSFTLPGSVRERRPFPRLPLLGGQQQPADLTCSGDSVFCSLRRLKGRWRQRRRRWRRRRAITKSPLSLMEVNLINQVLHVCVCVDAVYELDVCGYTYRKGKENEIRENRE